MTKKQEIEDLLSRLFIFEPEFKEEIRERLKTATRERLERVMSVLTEAYKWQEQILEKKLKADPGLYDRLLNKEIEIEHELVNNRREQIKNEDSGKIKELLSKIKEKF